MRRVRHLHLHRGLAEGGGGAAGRVGDEAGGDAEVGGLQIVLGLEAGVGQTLLQQHVGGPGGGRGGGEVSWLALDCLVRLGEAGGEAGAGVGAEREHGAGLAGHGAAVRGVAGVGGPAVQQQLLLLLDAVLQRRELQQRLLQVDGAHVHGLLEAGGHRVRGLGGLPPLAARRGRVGRGGGEGGCGGGGAGLGVAGGEHGGLVRVAAGVGRGAVRGGGARHHAVLARPRHRAQRGQQVQVKLQLGHVECGEGRAAGHQVHHLQQDTLLGTRGY